MIPFVDLKNQFRAIKHEILEAIEEVCENTSFILGNQVIEFENNFAKMHNATYCAGVGSGTDALVFALKALDIGPDDEVIIPANTFIATALAVTATGATIVFADIDENTYNIDPYCIEKLITDKTKCIIPVHLYGLPADMNRITKIANDNNLYLVEDACQAHFAQYMGKYVGSFGHYGCFSFYPGKNLGAYGDGGAVLTNNEELYSKISFLRNYGQIKKYHHVTKGMNSRLDSLQAAVLNVKLKYIEKWTELRRQNAALYNKYLGEIDELKLTNAPDGYKHVYHLYVIRLLKGNRDELSSFLSEKDIQNGIHYPIPIYSQKAYSEYKDYENKCPITTKSSKEILSLPMCPELTEEDIKYVADSIKEFFTKV